MTRPGAPRPLLLFDEADALLGERGDVRDGHDRYANLKVTYLPRRMEPYEVSSNSCATSAPR